MRTWILRLWLCSALCSTCIAPASADPSPNRLTPQVRAVDRVKKAVVDINTERTSRDRDAALDGGPGRKINGMGTGIIIDERGYIVTNQHVISETTSQRVTLYDGSTYRGEVISYDPRHDLAIIKIESTHALPVAPQGTSSDVMQGESVIAIGNPFGYEHSVSMGIVSALLRDVEVNEHQSYQHLIQTDAAINPGNSGGPLVNLDGEVIGINVAIRAGAQRIGFAIPIDDARKYIANLLDSRKLSDTYHGLVGHDVKTPEHRKLVVDAAEPNSPAAAAGFLPGDVVTFIGSRPIVDRADLERAFIGSQPGTPIEIVVVRRNQETVKLSMQLARAKSSGSSIASTPKNPPPVLRTGAPVEMSVATRIWKLMGMKVEKVPASVIKPIHENYNGGMKVIEVRGDSPAAKHGMKKGDVLVGLNGYETIRSEDIIWVLDNKPKVGTGEELLKFHILRGSDVMLGEMQLGQPVRR